jgi:hypothetical protein
MKQALKYYTRCFYRTLQLWASDTRNLIFYITLLALVFGLTIFTSSEVLATIPLESRHFSIAAFVLFLMARFFSSFYLLAKEDKEKIAILEDRLKPRLKAVYDPTKPPCRSVSTFSDGRQHMDGMCFRIEVENLKEETMSNCEGHLVEVRYEDDPIELGAMNLTWADMPQATVKINLVKNVKRHLDILTIYQNHSIRISSQGWPINRQNFFQRRGAYILSVVVSGGEMALDPYRLRLNYTGDWQTSTLDPL